MSAVLRNISGRAFPPGEQEENYFLALQPTEAARKLATGHQQHFRTLHGLHGYGLRPENFHLSLHPVGENGAPSESQLAAADEAAASVVFPPFEVTLDHALSFRNNQPQKPLVLCGRQGVVALKQFHEILGTALRNKGLPHIRRGLTPHLTLLWDEVWIEKSEVAPISWLVNEFVLVRSLVGQGRHEVIKRWALVGPPDVSATLDRSKGQPVRLVSAPRPHTSPAHDYVELHARSAFSFLRGASAPDALAQTAATLGLRSVGLLDRDGLYGAPRFYSAAREHRLRARVGAEITMEDGSVVPLLVATRTGYQNLCQLITEAKLTERPPGILEPWLRRPPAESQDSVAGRRSHLPDPRDRKRPCFATWAELARFSEGLIAFTGDEEGPLRRAWRTAGAEAARTALENLAAIFGRAADPAHARLFVELQRHRLRGEAREINFLRDLATAQRLPLLATGGVNHANAEHRLVADVFTCLRSHTTLDGAGRRLDINAERRLKSAPEMQALFSDLPDALANSVRLDDRLGFTLENLGYQFPGFPTPNGETMDAYLRGRTFAAAHERFGALPEKLHQQLNKELELIARLKFSGYFLIVWDICAWARAQKILVQGRGSAANSAVCYVLGITAVDPLKHRLLFERFLSDGRIGADGHPSWPDIDLDLPSGERRESVIQEIYRRYGQRGAAMTANVITYRGRSTTREIGKVLGFGDDALDRFSSLYANGDFPETLGLQEQLKLAGVAAHHPRAAAMVRLNHLVRGLPRHLGQHSGGMVISRHLLDQVVPLEPATMPGRSVCQWDKDDCESLGIVKIDFLGLGMMSVLQDSFELCAHRGGPHTFNDIPPDDPETYEKIRAADTVGVFQIESRAQMATLPRFKPVDLYDLAIQVAIIRPGPITGNLVHPLIRRRDGLEKDDYIDPSVEEKVKQILSRTRGVILFQEQMLELSMTLAKFTGAEAEELRRAMGFTRGTERLEKALAKLCAALRREGHNEAVVDRVTKSATTFAAYGFPESHAIGFAMLAYASTWLKIHRPAEFYASLLNNQPMGFYSPATLLQDGRRHELKANPVCLAASHWECTVEGEKTIRIGLRFVKGLREATAKEMLAARREKPFASLDDFLRRTDFNATERRALAAVGALDVFSHHRRTALWQVEAAWSDDEALFKQFADAYRDDSPLTAMSRVEEVQADFSGLGLTTGEHPMALVRASLPEVCAAKDLRYVADGQRVTIAGSVICRQRPGTAAGFVFISLEDETGIANAVVIPQLFERLRLIITQEPSLRISGKLQSVANVTHVKAESIEPLRVAAVPAQASHDFR